MIELLVLLSLSGVSGQTLARTPQPCVWPNTCVEQVTLAHQPCVWPNRCAQSSEATL